MLTNDIRIETVSWNSKYVFLFKEVESLGQRLGYTCDNRRLHNVSLGQGQEKVAEEALKVAAKEGHWVILQVI